MERVDEGVKVGGYQLKDVWFADNQGMVASAEKRLQTILDTLNNTAKMYDIMKISKNGGVINIVIDGQKVEQVDKFKYLGAWITEDGRCETEIRARI